MVAFAELSLEARTEELKRAIDEIRKIGVEGERTEDKVRKSTNAMAAGFGKVAGYLGGLAAGVVSVQTAMASMAMARGFDAALAETSTLISGTAQELAFLEENARSMARQFGGDATQQVQAFYQAISAGAGSVENAAKLLDSANKLAIGGVTSTVTAVDALTTATNAYAKQGLTAADASDAMFVAIRAGKTNASELGAALGNIVPIASSVGIGFDEILGATAALTTQGQSTSMAVTGLRQVIAGVIKPTKEATDMAKALGLEFSTQAIQAKGLAGFLTDVVAKTGGSQDAMARLFGSVEALNAVLAFSGGAGTAFNDIMGQMAERAGATDEAFNKMSESLSQRWNVQVAIARDALLALGGVLLAGAVPALEAATSAAQFVADNMSILGAVAVGLAATQIPALVTALAAKTAGMSAAAIAAGVLSGAMRVLGTAVALAGGPLGLLLGILGGAAAAVLLFRDNTATAAPIMDQAKDATERLNAALANSSEAALPAAARATLNLTNENIKLAKSAYAAAEAELAKASANAYAAQQQLGAESMSSLPLESLPGYARNQQAIDNLAAANRALQEAQKGLTDRIAEGQLALSSAGAAVDEYNAKSIALSVTMDDLAGKVGGGAKGGAKDDGFIGRLKSLQEQFQTEREAIDAWYKESQAILADRRAMELLGEQNHKAMLLQVEELYQQQLAALRRQANQQTFTEAGTFFGAMAGLAQAGGEKFVKIQRTMAAAQGLINAYLAATQVLADPKLGFFGKMAAYVSVLSAGLGLVSAIKGGGGGSVGASAAATSAGREPTTAPAQQQRVIRFDVQGDGMFADMLRQNVEVIADAIVNEQRLGGTTILVGRS
jgi:TP901 family phage tail tape measure protein